ncbi:MAG: ABC transporter substrate-binding protein [Roseiflexaceae bacterium]|nr:ABC transporter substrate-binding protein [Roseiflexaceae bacterium]
MARLKAQLISTMMLTTLLMLTACSAAPQASAPSPVRTAEQPTAASTGGVQPTHAPATSDNQAAPGEPIWIGVSGPLTGPNAQYGAQWKKGFDLALDQINGNGGINGRPLQYIFEDTQSDPKQTVAVAQKFVNDPRIVIQLGDFASPASMAASPIYERAGLVQFGFTNSHPDFTKGGEYMWSNAISQEDNAPILADYAVTDLGLRRLAVLHLNTDWGRVTKDLFVAAVEERGGEVVAVEGYLPEEKDFRSTLTRVRDANPDGLVLISYYADGALITRQVRDTGLTLPIVASGSIYSPKFLELAGDAANGVYTTTNFFPGEDREEVRAFVSAFRAKYGEDPDSFAAGAYDTMILVYHVIKQAGPDRKAIRDTLATIKDVPSVIYGKVQFNPETRRISNPRNIQLVIRDGRYTVWDGVPLANR